MKRKRKRHANIGTKKKEQASFRISTKSKRSSIIYQLIYSHRLYIYSYFNKVKFIGKTVVVLFGIVKQDITKAAINLKSKRSINIFTGRGVRFSRQVVYKKQGKVSSYR